MVRNINTLTTLLYMYGGLTILIGLALGTLFLGLGFLRRAHFEQSGLVRQIIGGVLAASIVPLGILICLSGHWIAKRRNRIASMVIAGFCCLIFPLGTLLGIFTFVVLNDEEVKGTYTPVPWVNPGRPSLTDHPSRE